MSQPPAVSEAAATAIGLLVARGWSAGTAESLTGGLVAAALTSVPGASVVFRGGIVAYSADLKASLLGVPGELLDRVGTVHADVAGAMANGARQRLSAIVGIATTGVAGPDPVGNHPVGTVHVAVSVRYPAGPGASGAGGDLVDGKGARVLHRQLSLSGDRASIRTGTVAEVLNLLVHALSEEHE